MHKSMNILKDAELYALIVSCIVCELYSFQLSKKNKTQLLDQLSMF